MPMVIIVNPASQGGALGQKWPEIAARLRRTLGGFEERLTSAGGEATNLARAALDGGADRVVAIGGDGTIGEVAGGFFDGNRRVSETAALGIIPFGTGGDFRKTVHIPKDLDRAAEILAADRVRTIDVGHIRFTRDDGTEGERIFINIASCGMSGVVDAYVNESKKRLGGTLSFFMATARASLSYKNQRVRLWFDADSEAVETTIHTLAVANGRYFGGGMMIAPEAEVDDAAFDVVQLGDFSLFEMIKSGHRVYGGTHLALDKVSHRRARSVR
ncbi:MAG TPA: diacylglycerol kinase family protein, partial [Kofleriaceae bacterium]|nr:diacylglycerol kinase family protein [Kofleriaceae bacterium]